MRGDVRDRQTVLSAAEGCDVVVDNAALVPVTTASAETYRAVNVGGCRNTVDAARKHGAYLVHISSSAIYGVPAQLPVTPSTPFAPFEPYGASKAEADRLVAQAREGGLTAASLRPRTLLGPGRLGLFDVIFARVSAGKPVPMFGPGRNQVQMCDVDDYCRAVEKAIELRANDDYNIGATGFGTVRSDLQALVDHAGTGARLLPVPTWAIEAVLRPLAAVGRSPFTEWHWRSAPESFYFDVAKPREELGWEPRRTTAEALVAAYDTYLRRPGDAAARSAHLRPLRGGLARVLRG